MLVALCELLLICWRIDSLQPEEFIPRLEPYRYINLPVCFTLLVSWQILFFFLNINFGIFFGSTIDRLSDVPNKLSHSQCGSVNGLLVQAV